MMGTIMSTKNKEKIHKTKEILRNNQKSLKID